MPTVTLLQAEGLVSSPNELTAPAGSLVEAINVLVYRKGIYQTRRGYSWRPITTDLGRITTAAERAFFDVTHHMDATTGYLRRYAEVGYVSGIVPRDDTLQRLNMVAAADRLWIADRRATKAASISTGTLALAPSGFPQPGDLVPSVGATPGWMAANTSVAYRATYVYYMDGRLIESAPSSRCIVNNTTANTRNPNPRLYFQEFPAGVEPQFVRLYRSDAVPLNSPPSDEMFLAAETAYTHAPGYIDIVDSQPEALLGAPLYTNPVTGDGILSSNLPPPNGVDVELFDGRLWVANTRGPSRATVTLIGVGAVPGLISGDTITVNGVAYRAQTSPTLSTDFQLSTGVSPQADVAATARNLVSTINNHNKTLGASAVVARYMSGDDDAAGVVGFEWRTADGGVGSAVAVSRATAWQMTQQTTVDHQPHGLAFSKADQPDAFPPVNFLLVNTSAAPIVRIHALRDRLFVFKADGVYVVSGQAPYRVDMLDDTAILVSPDAVAQCNGILYALTQQGAVAITDSGVRIVSMPIEQLIRTAMADAGVGEDFANRFPDKHLREWARNTFAASYETERLVTFWLDGTLGVVFNTLHSAWTINLPPLSTLTQRRKLEWAGVEPSTGRMVLWENAPQMPPLPPQWRRWVERKRLDRWDNADEVGSNLTILGTPPNDTTLPMQHTLLDVRVGDAFQVVTYNTPSPTTPGVLAFAVRVVGLATDAVIIDAPLAFDIAAAVAAAPNSDRIFSRGIPVLVRYAPITAGQPHLTKNFREATFHFLGYSVERANVICTTELVTNLPPDATQPVTGPQNLWTADRDGDETPVPRDNKRRLIPRDKARGAQLVIGWEVYEPFCHWLLCGVSVELDGVSERNSR